MAQYLEVPLVAPKAVATFLGALEPSACAWPASDSMPLSPLPCRGGRARSGSAWRLAHKASSVWTISIYYPLSRLQQARAYALMGDTTRSRASYEAFLTAWQDADPDVPVPARSEARNQPAEARKSLRATGVPRALATKLYGRTRMITGSFETRVLNRWPCD
jgi:hypothetical protein